MIFLTLMLLSCGDSPMEALPEPVEEIPPHARLDLQLSLLQDLTSAPHPSDGGGRAWLVDPQPATVGEAGHWTIVYEAGPQGIARGGLLTLQASPFWDWSDPQTHDPSRPGYTLVSTEAEGVELEVEPLGDGLLGVEIAGRALAPGERITLDYGAGEAGALPDRYAEDQARIWLAVDGDGDGYRTLVHDSPSVDVLPARAVGLVCHLPSTAHPGQEVELRVAALDARADLSTWEGLVRVEGTDLEVSLTQGAGLVRFTPPEAGVYRLSVQAGDLAGPCNPMLVSEGIPAVLWGDLHGHSGLSDGTGTPAQYFRYARVAAGLDVAALTDHDHWGFEKLDEHPVLWTATQAAVEEADEPGRFTAVLGYEWTSWLWGHRHVLYLDQPGPVLSSLSEETDHPQELLDALRLVPGALIIPHHPAGGPVPVEWVEEEDPMVMPAVELTSVHGQSEHPDGPGSIYSPQPGYFARDLLDAGHRLGFLGSGDSHDGHPGLAHLGQGQGGVLALVGAENTRQGVLEGLRSRRVYATTGPRVLILSTLDQQPMGSVLPPSSESTLVLWALSPEPVVAVDLVRSGRLEATVDTEGQEEVQLSLTLADLAAGEYTYLRLRLASGAMAWTSPSYIEGSEPSEVKPSPPPPG